jgi:hypothetical protein
MESTFICFLGLSVAEGCAGSGELLPGLNSGDEDSGSGVGMEPCIEDDT